MSIFRNVGGSDSFSNWSNDCHDKKRFESEVVKSASPMQMRWRWTLERMYNGGWTLCETVRLLTNLRLCQCLSIMSPVADSLTPCVDLFHLFSGGEAVFVLFIRWIEYLTGQDTQVSTHNNTPKVVKCVWLCDWSTFPGCLKKWSKTDFENKLSKCF